MRRLVAAVALALALSGCGSTEDGAERQLSIPEVVTVDVGGWPLTCIQIVGYSNYGGGVSCDWDGWRELQY